MLNFIYLRLNYFTMKKSIIVAFAITFAVAFSACNNDEPVELTKYEITFDIVEPEEGAVFTSGDELHMEVDVQGTKAIGNVELLAINLTSGDTIANYYMTSTSDFLMMHEHADLLVTEVADCQFIVSAWETNYADRISETRNFTINP